MTDISYDSFYLMSDKALAEIIGNFVQHHRLIQNKSQQEVARDAGISRSTLSLLERGETVTLSTFIQVLRVLELLHVLESFRIETMVSPIQLAKLEVKKRRRARKSAFINKTESDW